MDSDSDKENYFSLYMKKKKKNENKKEQFHSNKRYKNKSVSSQKIKDDSKIKSALKLILERSTVISSVFDRSLPPIKYVS